MKIFAQILTFIWLFTFQSALAQMNSNLDTFYLQWEKRKLICSDFNKEKMPANISANSSIKLWIEPSFNKGNYEFRFYTLFDRNNSNINVDHIKDSTYILQHEQLHFDIYEIGCRKLIRQLIFNIDSLLEINNSNSFEETLKVILEYKDNFVKLEISKMHHELDNDANNIESSNYLQTLTNWRIRIDKMLLDLDLYKNKTVMIPKKK